MRLNPSLATARGTSIIAKAGGDHRHVKADRVEASQQFTRVPGPGRYSRARASRARNAQSAAEGTCRHVDKVKGRTGERLPMTDEQSVHWLSQERAEFDRIDAEAGVEFDRIVDEAQAEFKRVFDPAKADLDRVLAEAEAEAEAKRVRSEARAEFHRVFDEAKAKEVRAIAEALEVRRSIAESNRFPRLNQAWRLGPLPRKLKRLLT